MESTAISILDSDILSSEVSEFDYELFSQKSKYRIRCLVSDINRVAGLNSFNLSIYHVSKDVNKKVFRSAKLRGTQSKVADSAFYERSDKLKIHPLTVYQSYNYTGKVLELIDLTLRNEFPLDNINDSVFLKEVFYGGSCRVYHGQDEGEVVFINLHTNNESLSDAFAPVKGMRFFPRIPGLMGSIDYIEDKEDINKYKQICTTRYKKIQLSTVWGDLKIHHTEISSKNGDLNHALNGVSNNLKIINKLFGGDKCKNIKAIINEIKEVLTLGKHLEKGDISHIALHIRSVLTIISEVMSKHEYYGGGTRHKDDAIMSAGLNKYVNNSVMIYDYIGKVRYELCLRYGVELNSILNGIAHPEQTIKAFEKYSEYPQDKNVREELTATIINYFNEYTSVFKYSFDIIKNHLEDELKKMNQINDALFIDNGCDFDSFSSEVAGQLAADSVDVDFSEYDSITLSETQDYQSIINGGSFNVIVYFHAYGEVCTDHEKDFSTTRSINFKFGVECSIDGIGENGDININWGFENSNVRSFLLHDSVLFDDAESNSATAISHP